MTIYRPGQHIYYPGSGVRVVQPGGAGNGLLNALIAYWPGNEANGDALDLHTNALHLTDTNTVTSAAGLVYATARQYTQANFEYHSRAGDDALLSAGDTDFTLAAWVWIDNLVHPSLYPGIVSKDSGAGSREYYLMWRRDLSRLCFRAMDGAASIGEAAADSLGAPAANTWYLVIGWHDSVSNTCNIQVNNGGVDFVATTGVPGDTAAVFRIGMDYSEAARSWNGRIGPTMFWKSAAGGGGVLTAAQRTALYNAGAGLPYASFTA